MARATLKRWVCATAAVLVLVGVGGALGLHRDATGPAPTAAPTRTPEPVRTALLASSGGGPSATSAGLQQALAKALTARGLGRRVVLSVVDAGTGRPLLERSAAQAVLPASTTKIVTAVAALTVLPSDRRLVTRVLAGPLPGDVVLVGAGDPTLSGRFPVGGYPQAGRMLDLVRQVKASGTVVRRVLVDDGLFTGPRTGPGWKPGYVSSGNVSPVSALAVDAGRVGPRAHAGRAADPALYAGRQLGTALGSKAVLRGAAPTGARVLAAVSSPTVAQLVEAMLTRSDNDLAEALGRQVALEVHQPASFAGEAKGVEQVLAPLLVQAGLAADAVRLSDTSGLSTLNRIEPAGLTRLLALAACDDRYAPVLSGLPVAGFVGTLADRYRTSSTSAAAGVVRAKTGTLDGVSALAGLVRTRQGQLLAFDLTADGVPVGATLDAQLALDRIAAVLASCGCT